MGDQRLSDADIGDILDNYLLQQNGNKRSPSPFDPSEALFGAGRVSSPAQPLAARQCGRVLAICSASQLVVGTLQSLIQRPKADVVL